MDPLERAAVLDELDGVLATATMGGRAVLLVGEAGLEGSSSASRGNVWRAVQQFGSFSCDPSPMVDSPVGLP